MRFIEADVCYCSNRQIVNDAGWPVYSVFVATRCQAVENVNYRVHRLATVATLIAKWRHPAKKTDSLV